MGLSEIGAVVAAPIHYVLNACPILQLQRAAVVGWSAFLVMTALIKHIVVL